MRPTASTVTNYALRTAFSLLGAFVALATFLTSTTSRAAAQEHPARRLSSIVAVAVEEYGKAVDERGKLISATEFQEASDFLVDAKLVAGRLAGSQAATAREVLDSLTVAMAAKRPPSELDALRKRFALALGEEGALEMPRGSLDLASGKATGWPMRRSKSWRSMVISSPSWASRGTTQSQGGSAASAWNPT